MINKSKRCSIPFLVMISLNWHSRSAQRNMCIAKPLAPPAKDSLRSSFPSGGLSRLGRLILAFHACGLFPTYRFKPSAFGSQYLRFALVAYFAPLVFRLRRTLAPSALDTRRFALVAYFSQTVLNQAPSALNTRASRLWFISHRPC